MPGDDQKSNNQSLYKRACELFWSIVIASWIVCNWNAIFFAFTDQPQLQESKVSYITRNYADLKHLLYYPAACTIVLIVVIPLMTNTLFYILLKFSNWRSIQKNKVESERQAAMEFSHLEQQLHLLEMAHEKKVSELDKEIKKLNEIISSSEKKAEPAARFTIANKQTEHGKLFVEMDTPRT